MTETDGTLGTLDDSWFERPERGISRAEVLAAAAAVVAGTATSDGAIDTRAEATEGLDDSWFDRPPRERRRAR